MILLHMTKPGLYDRDYHQNREKAKQSEKYGKIVNSWKIELPFRIDDNNDEKSDENDLKFELNFQNVIKVFYYLIFISNSVEYKKDINNKIYISDINSFENIILQIFCHCYFIPNMFNINIKLAIRKSENLTNIFNNPRYSLINYDQNKIIEYCNQIINYIKFNESTEDKTNKQNEINIINNINNMISKLNIDAKDLKNIVSINNEKIDCLNDEFKEFVSMCYTYYTLEKEDFQIFVDTGKHICFDGLSGDAKRFMFCCMALKLFEIVASTSNIAEMV